MKQSLHIGSEPNLQKIIIASTVMHLLFIALITVPIKTKEREYKSYFVNLVAPVEVPRTLETQPVNKSLPPKTITKKIVKKEREAVKTKTPPRKREVPKKGVSLEPEKPAERVSREIERLRAIKDLAKRKEEQKTEQLAKASETDEEMAQALERIRNKVQASISKGPGIPGRQTSSDVNPYLALVVQKITEEWIHFDFGHENYEVIISFNINSMGNIIGPKIVRSSGNDLFDRSAMKAVIKASPLPPPPVEEEFELRFHL